ncbi:MAG: glycoside hydrolase family 16 protein [Bacteroidales bacterium]|jgi:beta-glucanase (GH16 family)|nr:glycoside hydrolase family 16 protein [Bacteroidales bacterium]
MKTYYKIGCIAFLIVNVICLQGVSQRCDDYTNKITQQIDIVCDNNPYMLVFEDNFDGNALDETKWDIVEGLARDFIFKSQKAWHTRNNIVVENGLLKIITKREHLTHMQHWNNDWTAIVYSDFDFTTGEISTKSKFPRNGKIEARIKIPLTQGLWPAFWLWDASTHYNELDIFEVNTTEQTYSTNVHYNGANNQYESSSKVDCKENHDYIGNTFHTFTVIWNEDRIEWYIDETLIRQLPFYFTRKLRGWFGLTYDHYCNDVKAGKKYRRHKAFPSDAMNIVFNTAVPSPNSGGAPYSYTSFPATMEVDYIKVYQRKPCTTDVSVTNLPNPFNCYPIGNNILYRLITGKNVNMVCNMIIPATYNVKVKAKESITLGNGFNLNVADGGEFLVSMDENLCNANKRIFVESILTGEEEDFDNDDEDTIGFYDEIKKLFVYPTLNDDGRVVIDFRDNDFNDISLSIADESNRQKYSIGKINEPIFYIDMSNYDIGEYTLQLTNNKTDESLMYNIIIIE